jgi:hypothetical protein
VLVTLAVLMPSCCSHAPAKNTAPPASAMRQTRGCAGVALRLCS